MDVVSSLKYFVPELILTGGSLAVLLLDLFNLNKKILGLLSVLSIVLAFLSLPTTIHQPIWIFSELYLLDGLGHLFKIFVFLATGISILATINSDQIPEKQKGEFYVLMLALAFLLIVMGSSTNLLMIFLAIESVSLTSYILVGFQKFNKRSSEASLKYLLFGAVASATMLFGISLLFGLTGTLELTQMSIAITQGGPDSIRCALVSLLFLLVGFGFKVSMVPFHMWAPDVYEGAPTPVAAFLTVAPKSLGFVVLFRLLLIAFPFAYAKWSSILTVLSILTMTIGNVVAVSQSNVKRILAYSSIAQAGYVLMGLATANEIGIQAIFIYLTTYLFTNLGAFLTVSIIEQSEKSNNLSAYNGLGKRSPGLAATLTIFLLSLAGIPPLAGFIAKWYVFASAMQGKFLVLAISAALNSAIAGYYYFKIVKAIYLTPAEQISPVRTNSFSRVAVLIALAGVIVIGLFPSPIISIIQNVLASFRMV